MKFYILILSFFIFNWTNGQGSSCGTSISLGTPSTTTSCVTQSNGTTGSSGCAGGGYGGNSNGLTYFSFCTNANADCIEFDFSNGTSSGNWTARIYTVGCGSFVDGSCLGDIGTGATFTTSAAGLVANTCYVLLISNQNSGTFTICNQTNPLPNDDCNGALAIDSNPLSTDNKCASPGPTTNTPTITPAMLCAGSLENTSWYTFTVLNTADVVVTIDNITCIGGASGYQIGYFTGICGTLSNLGCVSGSGGSATTTITGLTAGEVVTIAMDGNAGAICDFEISATNTVLLPVELKYFRVTQKIKRINNLYWETASELNNDKFIIEISTNLKTWTIIGEIEGAGNSSSEIQYSFTDNSPIGQISYYRLKQVDFDGKVKYSEIVSVENDYDIKTVVKRYDLLGRIVDESFIGFIIMIYSDGTKEKLFKSY